MLGEGRHVVLSADLGPAQRYRSFLAVSRGAVRVVVGTRAAAFAPVRDLGLVAMWDDGDDLYAEPRAPYPHTREVLLTRAQEESTAVLLGGFARTVEAEYLLRTGWAEPLQADRAGLRAAAPQVTITGATDRELERDPHARTARLPRTAYDAIREGLTQGPVLLQTPAAGLRHRARLRHLPHPRPLPGVQRAAAADRRPRAAELPVVRPRRAGLVLRGVRWPRAAGPGRWGSSAPPRSSAARSRRCRCAPPAATGCWPPSTRGRRWWWPRREPSRSRRTATPAWCCSTPG